MGPRDDADCWTQFLRRSVAPSGLTGPGCSSTMPTGACSKLVRGSRASHGDAYRHSGSSGRPGRRRPRPWSPLEPDSLHPPRPASDPTRVRQGGEAPPAPVAASSHCASEHARQPTGGHELSRCALASDRLNHPLLGATDPGDGPPRGAKFGRRGRYGAIRRMSRAAAALLQPRIDGHGRRGTSLQRVQSTRRRRSGHNNHGVGP